LYSIRHCSIFDRAPSSDRNQFVARHSFRKLPLNDSIIALSVVDANELRSSAGRLHSRQRLNDIRAGDRLVRVDHQALSGEENNEREASKSPSIKERVGHEDHRS
jgi:hypothetical protein